MSHVHVDPSPEAPAERPETDERELAGKRLLARRDFGSHLLAYVVINVFLIGIWAFTGHGYFWPGWVIAGWGLALVFHARETFWRRPVTDFEIDEELRRHQR